LFRTKIKRLASDGFFDRSGSGDVGSASRIFLEFTTERNLFGGLLRGAIPVRTSRQGLPYYSKHTPQYGDQHDHQKQFENYAEHALFRL
jgi:hypothetical protein